MTDSFLLQISEQLLQENKRLKGAQAAKYKQGFKAGRKAERERIIQRLIDYFELTQEPGDHGLIDVNEEWDSGFQAAIALIKGEPE